MRKYVNSMKRKVSSKVEQHHLVASKDAHHVYYRPKIVDVPELFAEDLVRLNAISLCLLC